VAVPEIYGWCRDGNVDFVYMELVEGDTLEQRWPSLSAEERWEISKQLRGMLKSLASLEQKDLFIGGPTRQPLQDRIFTYLRPKSGKGPFSSVKEFHDWYTSLPYEGFELPEGFVDQCRHELPDDAPVRFTHNDLHPSNIMISPKHAAKLEIRAIIDWHQSGWYPAYWEACKLRWSVPSGGEWAMTYLPQISDKPFCYDAWFFYIDALCAV